jgi:hypothetical protein
MLGGSYAQGGFSAQRQQGRGNPEVGDGNRLVHEFCGERRGWRDLKMLQVPFLLDLDFLVTEMAELVLNCTRRELCFLSTEWCQGCWASIVRMTDFGVTGISRCLKLKPSTVFLPRTSRTLVKAPVHVKVSKMAGTFKKSKVMKMVSSRFYWLDETMVELYVGLAVQ